jgi:mannose/cellobiose epimerase-like protein (N-acyl-D-glucosamine 2-epimerase family)
MTRFIDSAGSRYVAMNVATLRWMLARPRPHGAFLDTKLNPVTLKDYDVTDGWRGPDWTYGWIQGRGLESLAVHAEVFATTDQDLMAALDDAGRGLYAALDKLQTRDGHGYFRYGPDMRPVCGADDGPLEPQVADGDVFTYSDAFFAKGLIAGAARYAPADLPRQLAALARVIEAIEDCRFQMAEKVPLSPLTARAEPGDFGPRMILLGAAGLLRRLGRTDATEYADRFIDHILSRHLDSASGLLRNVAGQEACNVGHGIEFVGFALDHLGPDGDPDTIRTLERVLVASFDRGLVGPGIRLLVSAATGRPLSPFCPWWPLPETIRAASLAYAATGSADAMRIWKVADERFLEGYWRGDPPIAYQCLTPDGPVDYVPATPDLDPGYHTGLSLLAAARVAEAAASRESA